MSGEGAAPRLTPREREVLAAIGRHWSNVEIAREFFVSVRTVESHVAALRHKLGAASRADLIRLASRHLARPVPVPANSFVGREDELRDVRRLLDRTPWVTITGPPGSGKTRLALELAQRSPRGRPGTGRRRVGPERAGRRRDAPRVRPGHRGASAAAGTGDPTDDLAAACALALGTGHFLLTLPELADRLDESLAVLDRAGPAHRHRRLESAFDWTWDLLDDEERELLQLLAAMPGNFDMTLVESVAPDLPGGASRVALRLLDRSLIAPAGAPSEPARFRLLDSLRRFVGGLTPPEVAAGARRRHAELHAQASEAIASRIGTDDDLSLIARAQRLIPEAAAALLWVAPLDADLGLRLARSLAILAEHAGRTSRR